MAYSDERLTKIYDKTDGNCHLCHKKLAFTNYGKNEARGSWHVEHSVPKAKGGTEHLNNLYAACIKCNLEKGTYHTKTVRSWNGNTRAPYSSSKKAQIESDNTIGGAAIGVTIGLLFGGPLGAAVGALIGGAYGNSNSPKK